MAGELLIEGASEAIVELAPDLATDIGARLKLIRERNGLSQRELAKRAGITNSNISMIEQGLVSPSVNSLARVLSGIPMSLSQFFSCNQVDIGQMIYPADALAAEQVQRGDIVTQVVALEKKQRKLNMTRQVLPAGSDTGAEPQRCKTELSGIVVAGKIELTAGIQVHTLHEGDAFYLAAMQPYRIRNHDADVAIIIATNLAQD